MNVQSFPRPPRLEQTSRHLQIKYLGQLIADTKEAYWALETHHPPTYYLPRSSVRIPLTTTKKQTICEFKGVATYYKVELADGTAVSDRIWSYERPTPAFKPIHGYLSFYAGPWDCFVDGEKVEAQPGDFYGGWVTSDIEGIVKGRTGNLDPIV
ncbi:hypothetical protein QQS21_010738 [Conoideocrella luteorostrata]|uniref:DUF427 domain-containing protein n=1 Tax=Conoideocrella luteorostrata TaxID=1105319 RepID=A0AAJ0FUD5_9HYPO|nr:hypothetical protein QQS21_010738 [Conoideocrella luteorostrata]